jgi:D-alanyl-lipoteichoic acid acyltransferase DltB (MBOAT superfamily)
MIPLLLGSSILFYGIGHWLKAEMEKEHTKVASNITTFGVVLGICILLYFKYLNFFAESIALFLHSIGMNVSWSTLNIVLPIGVSFFTFKLISYVIEIHREHICPSRNFIEFGTYIAFFPTILSGPIDRPNKFIPQLREVRLFKYDLAVDGCRQILWGMFTKMCIADNLANAINGIWTNIEGTNSSTLILAALLYPLQMYADFDGYSNMAIGVGKVLGINISRNFNHPFLARNIAEYWRNWHISLTGWLTDYVFSPLNIAFRNHGKMGVIFAILFNFIFIGLWHDANWTYAVFGLYHGFLYIPLVYFNTISKRKKIKPTHLGGPNLTDVIKICETYLLVSFGLIIFHSSSLGETGHYIYSIFANSFFPIVIPSKRVIPFIIILIILEWIQRDKEHALGFSNVKWLNNIYVRWSIYLIILFLIFFIHGEDSDFIYFKF